MIKFGLLYLSLFYGKRRNNGKQLYGVVLCRDNPADYLLLCWGGGYHRLYTLREHNRQQEESGE